MTDEMKLLRALIDALGFDVEEVDDGDKDAYIAAQKQYCISSFNIDGAVINPKPSPEMFYTSDYRLTRRVKK